MARPLRDNLHSRLVRVLKIALPLIALLLLSTLFLFSRKINPEDAIPYASVDVDDRLRLRLAAGGRGRRRLLGLRFGAEELVDVEVRAIEATS